MASHSTRHGSGANSSQDGLSNIRMVVRRIFEWGSIGIAIVILIVCVKFFIPWGSFFPHTLPYPTGFQPQLAAPYGCRGAEDDLTMPAGQKFVLPDHCLFNFNVTAGTIYLEDQGGGKPILVSAGQTVSFPPGFHPKRMWSVGGATIQPEFYPT